MERDMPRVVIVADHASLRFGGEASLPVHHFAGLRRRGIEAWLVVHERTRDELAEVLPGDLDRIHFLPDTRLNRLCWRIGRLVPAQLSYFTLGYLGRLATQIAARRAARALVRRHGATVVHQPIPVSPREPSLLYDMGAPVVIGPMNGNMSYPPAFRGARPGRRLVGALTGLGRLLSVPLHGVMPGKRRAALLLVANDRTRQALPRGLAGEIRELAENGVDLGLWRAPGPRRGEGAARFVFMGRLVELKAVDVLLEALARMRDTTARLEIIGDGPKRTDLAQLSRRLGLADRVSFAGWQTQAACAARLAAADALVLPSIHECGGAVVLEAMAMARPVVATDWGGPADYLDPGCGILVPPTSREALAAGFAAAMDRLAADPELRARLGRAGREKVERSYSWAGKIDIMLGLYREVAAGRISPLAPGPAKG